MSKQKVTHYAKIKKGEGSTYVVNKHFISDVNYTGIDQETATYLRKIGHIEVITANQYKKDVLGEKQPAKEQPAKQETKKAEKAGK